MIVHNTDHDECSDNQFTCDSGQCVSQYDRCDDFTDCRDDSDEKGCGMRTILLIIYITLMKNIACVYHS